MRSDRSSYSSSPTTGIKNKSGWKKMGLFSDKVDQVPDFDSIPVQNAGAGYQAGTPDFSYAPQRNPETQAGFTQPLENYVPYAPAQPTQPAQPQQPYTYGGAPRQAPTYYEQAAPKQSEHVKPAAPTPPAAPPPPTPPPQQQPPRAPSSKLSTAQLVTLFLAVVLPFVFIIAFFANQLFYSFIALAAVGAVVMWYRELYSPTVRVLISIALALTCVFGAVKITQIPTSSSTVLSPQSDITIHLTVTEEPAPQTEGDLLETEPPSTPTPTEEKSDVELRLSAFMEMWKTGNTEAMLEYVQPSWCNKQSDPAKALFVLLANRTAVDYQIESVSGTATDTSRSVSMTATIDKNTGKKASVYRFTVMMVKEGELWYVNPNSLATNDEVTDTADTIVVNDSNSTTHVTEAPRTTVSPVPPGSTLLYYNPDGGSKYHMDPNCPSVKSEYLPLQGSFTYAELGTYIETYGLSVCVRCNAPVNTLPPE